MIKLLALPILLAALGTVAYTEEARARAPWREAAVALSATYTGAKHAEGLSGESHGVAYTVQPEGGATVWRAVVPGAAAVSIQLGGDSPDPVVAQVLRALGRDDVSATGPTDRVLRLLASGRRDALFHALDEGMTLQHGELRQQTDVALQEGTIRAGVVRTTLSAAALSLRHGGRSLVDTAEIDASPEVRSLYAVVALTRGAAETEVLRARWLRVGTDPALRRAALATMPLSSLHVHLDAVTEATRSEPVADLALRVSMRGGARVHLPVVATALRSDNADVRAAAVEVAAAQHPGRLAKTLRAALLDVSPIVRRAAASAVGRSGDVTDVAALRKMAVQDEAGPVRLAARAAADAITVRHDLRPHRRLAPRRTPYVA